MRFNALECSNQFCIKRQLLSSSSFPRRRPCLLLHHYAIWTTVFLIFSIPCGVLVYFRYSRGECAFEIELKGAAELPLVPTVLRREDPETIADDSALSEHVTRQFG
jgi:hypothetical protein